jgi:pimeloyl-ACP methyl ester carboxylesterase
MATVVLVHGAWSSAWAWARMRAPMAAAGHDFLTPSLTGLGERAHLAGPGVDLETHVADIMGVLEAERLSGVTLLAHSYGGMVATGVADRARERVARLVYLDAFVPRDGESLFGLLDPGDAAEKARAAEVEGEGWQVPPNPVPPDTGAADRDWVLGLRRPQPIGTFRQALRLSAEPACPRAYVYCLRHPASDPFGRFAARAREEAWGYREIDASHSPNITAPGLLMETLSGVLEG